MHEFQRAIRTQWNYFEKCNFFSMKCKIKGLGCVYEHQVIAPTIMHIHECILIETCIRFDTLSLGFNRVLSSEQL